MTNTAINAEDVEVRELPLEEIEHVSGGETFNEILTATVILLKSIAAGITIYRGPLR